MDKYFENRKKLSFPVYEYDVHVIFNTDMKTAAKRLKKEGIHINCEDWGSRIGGYHFGCDDSPDSYILLPLESWSNQITHESYHCICSIMDWIGAKHEEEVFAYHLGYLTQEVVQIQKKSLEKYKKELDKAVQPVVV